MLNLSTLWLLTAQRFPFHINLKAYYCCYDFEAEGWHFVFPKLVCKNINHSLQNHTAVPSLSCSHDRFIRLKQGMGEEGEGMGEILRSFQNKQTSSQSLSLRGRGQRHCFALLAGGLGHFPTVLGSHRWVWSESCYQSEIPRMPWDTLGISLHYH